MATFKILHQQGKARVGQLQTKHGLINTPNFIPVGTQAAVKALSVQNLKDIGVQAVLANTYHLMLRPGENIIKSLGGLHKFMSWNGPIMTDSGGFQVFSLGVSLEHGVGKLLRDEDSAPKPRLNKITKDGVIFQSHLDGSKHILTPESSIDIQLKLGADLIVVFDDLESPKYSYEQTLKSLKLTEDWECRSKKHHDKICDREKCDHLLYGVTHGGIYKDLRIRSAKFVDENFAAIALGGAHKDKKTLYQVVEWTIGNVSDEKVRHLLGIGEVQDLFECVQRGIDLFDCAAPTRRARNGSLYISPEGAGRSAELLKRQNFTINIKSASFVKDKKPIDPSCDCFTCQNFSRTYLRHLYIAGEILYHQLASYHNLYFITNIMKEIRYAITANRFEKLKAQWIKD